MLVVMIMHGKSLVFQSVLAGYVWKDWKKVICSFLLHVLLDETRTELGLDEQF